MRLYIEEKIRYRIVDFINETSWLIIAVLSTATAIAWIWVLGFITMKIAL